MFIDIFQSVAHVTQVDLGQLRALGIQGLLFDLDNTLMPPHTGHLPGTVEAWLQDARNQGFKMAVVTNNGNIPYITAAGEKLQMAVFGSAHKPRRRQFLNALASLNLSPNQVVVVGDQVIADGWGAQRVGSRCILVHPLIAAEEPLLFKVCRAFERSLIRSIG